MVILELRQEHNLTMLLEIAQLPRATFYYHAKRMVQKDKYADIKTKITEIFHENQGRYGYRRITGELHNQNFAINHKTVQRLMKELGLVCRVRMKKYRSYKGEVGKVADNLLERDFHAERPNQKWTTDVTEFRLFGQKLYLSPIMDLCSGDIVTYTLSESPNLLMVTTMLEQALKVLPKKHDLILHSDQGWHYQHKQYRKMLAENSKLGFSFICAFSGGKDSLVLLDLVSKALAPSDFYAVFSNTGMELSDTLNAVEESKRRWPQIRFEEAKSHLDPTESWDEFGPPGRRMRWCCAVHKSVPTILKLREITGNYNAKAVVFDGVRAEESARRAKYGEESIGA